MKFTELNLKPELLEAISYMGFEEATPVQQQVIPVVMQDRDLIGVAQTGTGKTGAFVLPILNKLVGKKEHSIDTLILVPTRELAVQIDQQIQGFSYFIPAEVIAVYGGGSGQDWDAETHAFRHGADIIIATPGRLLSHIKMGSVNLGKLKHLVLDEADKMLDMGFIDDIRTIISAIPQKRQTLLFSATMPDGIRKLAKMILVNPAEVSLSVSIPAEGVDQKIYMTGEKQKENVLKHVLEERRHYGCILIFSSTKSKINDIVRGLVRAGFQAHGISSNFEQSKREQILRDFRSRKIRILVATDVMSRGIDIRDINLIINYDMPHNAEDYVHRVGRTARVKTEGEAVTLVTPKDMNALRKIEKLIGRAIPVIPVPAEIAVNGAENEGESSEQRVRSREQRAKGRWSKSKNKSQRAKSSRQGARGGDQSAKP